MELKKVNSSFQKVEDGLYEARIEEIALGYKAHKFLGLFQQKEHPSALFISNRKSPAWIFSLFTGYAQLGIFNIKLGTEEQWEMGEDIIVKIKEGKITNVYKTIEEINHEKKK